MKHFFTLFFLILTFQGISQGDTLPKNKSIEKKTEKKDIKKRVIKNYIRIRESQESHSLTGTLLNTLFKTIKPEPEKE